MLQHLMRCGKKRRGVNIISVIGTEINCKYILQSFFDRMEGQAAVFCRAQEVMFGKEWAEQCRSAIGDLTACRQ